jgi:archaellum component FlaD/FlaE
MSPQKPYLDGLDPDATDVRVVIDWMQYLGETFGTAGALDSLRYYERLGWITPAARDQLVGYLRGLGLEELHNKKYDEPGTLEGPLSALSGSPFGAHARSLEYVAAIAGDDLEAAVLRSSMAEQQVKPERRRAAPPTRPTETATDGGNTEMDGFSFSPTDD